jgi:hypothetical protein
VLRYLVLSTVIVVGAAVLATAWANRDLIRIKIAGSHLHGGAMGLAAGAVQPGSPAPLSGDAPWALSALPECLAQVSESRGSRRYVWAHLPAGAAPIRPPAVLIYGDCTITVAGDAAYVQRGADRLRIPPPVQFYRAAGELALIRQTKGRFELRLYQPVER